MRDVALVMAGHHLSERDACSLLDVDRSTYRYEPRPDRNEKLREAFARCKQKKAAGRGATFPLRTLGTADSQPLAAFRPL